MKEILIAGDMVSVYDGRKNPVWIDNGVWLGMTKKNVPRVMGTFNNQSDHQTEKVDAHDVLVKGKRVLYEARRWYIKKGWPTHDKEERQ